MAGATPAIRLLKKAMLKRQRIENSYISHQPAGTPDLFRALHVHGAPRLPYYFWTALRMQRVRIAL
jgi:hypothetical protein